MRGELLRRHHAGRHDALLSGVPRPSPLLWDLRRWLVLAVLLLEAVAHLHLRHLLALAVLLAVLRRRWRHRRHAVRHIRCALRWERRACPPLALPLALA